MKTKHKHKKKLKTKAKTKQKTKHTAGRYIVYAPTNYTYGFPAEFGPPGGPFSSFGEAVAALSAQIAGYNGIRVYESGEFNEHGTYNGYVLVVNTPGDTYYTVVLIGRNEEYRCNTGIPANYANGVWWCAVGT